MYLHMCVQQRGRRCVTLVSMTLPLSSLAQQHVGRQYWRKKEKKKRFKLLWQRACKWLKCPWAKHCSGSRHSVLFLEQIQWPRWEPAPFQESAAARMWENGRNSVEHTDSFSFLIRKLNIKYAKTCVTEPRSRKVIVLSKREFQQKYENETLMLQWLG